MRRARTTAGLLALLLVAGAGTPSHASEVSRRELASLAQRAADEPEALRRLRAVDSLEGRRMDLRRALAGAQGEDLRRRLEVLQDAAGPRRPIPGTAEAREQAQDILKSQRFSGCSVPRPFEGILRRIGGWLRPIGDAWRWVLELLPAGGSPGWWAMVLLVMITAAALSAVVVRRRSARGATRALRAVGADRSVDPRALEREADLAEERGDLEAAIRLRFRAGLIRLDRSNVIELRPWLTTGQIARTLRSVAFLELATTFDAVAYGRRQPSEADARSARDGWAELLRHEGAA